MSSFCYCSADKHSRPKALKTEEEQLLRAFYEFKIQDVCDAFKFPRKIQVIMSLVSMARIMHDHDSNLQFYVVQATALIYFKRFYLQWSVMEHHPKNIMYGTASSRLFSCRFVINCFPSCRIQWLEHMIMWLFHLFSPTPKSQKNKIKNSLTLRVNILLSGS